MRAVELDAHRTGQVAQERAVAARRLEHAAAIAPQREHRLHDRLRREHLAERGDVTQAEFELHAHCAAVRSAGADTSTAGWLHGFHRHPRARIGKQQSLRR